MALFFLRKRIFLSKKEMSCLKEKIGHIVIDRNCCYVQALSRDMILKLTLDGTDSGPEHSISIFFRVFLFIYWYSIK